MSDKNSVIFGKNSINFGKISRRILLSRILKISLADVLRFVYSEVVFDLKLK